MKISQNKTFISISGKRKQQEVTCALNCHYNQVITVFSERIFKGRMVGIQQSFGTVIGFAILGLP
jgi:hypothetical protein